MAVGGGGGNSGGGGGGGGDGGLGWPVLAFLGLVAVGILGLGALGAYQLAGGSEFETDEETTVVRAGDDSGGGDLW